MSITVGNITASYTIPANNITHVNIDSRPSDKMVKDILADAKARVEHGWIQGRSISSSGNRVCAGQAVSFAAESVRGFGLAGHHQAIAVLLEAAEELTGFPWMSVPSWNDHAGRTQDEVVLTFEHAIKMVEASS